jgi:hypothetical protein
MEDLMQTRLLAEYQANIDLWQHDDDLRQHRAGNFLTINTVLGAVLGTVVTLKPGAALLPWVVVSFALFGVILSIVWGAIHLRNAAYIRFRRFQLRSIEATLGGLTTFNNTYQAFYKQEPIEFAHLSETFVLKR